MPGIGHMETPAALNKIDRFDDPSLHEVQTSIVDSMSLPHMAEYVSAQHALVQDCVALQLIDEDIEECRMCIAHAHAQMQLLERQRDAVQRRVSIHRARLSPVRAVPDQVLQEIFQHCLPDDPYVVASVRSAPLVLTHVCRRWRTVAQDTSELWSSIALNDHGVWNCELEVQMVKRWLDRSLMRPVRMSITCPPYTNFGFGRGPPCSEIFQLAIAHSSHLRDLCLHADKTYLRHFTDRANFQALQSIVISLHAVRRVDEPPEPSVPALFSAPNLRRIALKSDEIPVNLIPRAVLAQITHLSLDCDMTLDHTLSFQDFPSLQHLTLKLTLSRDSLRFPFPPRTDHRVVVPSVLYLDVHLDGDMLQFGDPEKLETMLDRLELPALRVLFITAPPRVRDYEWSGCTEASWDERTAWVRSPGVSSLLSRSRYVRPRVECREPVCSR